MIRKPKVPNSSPAKVHAITTVRPLARVAVIRSLILRIEIPSDPTYAAPVC